MTISTTFTSDDDGAMLWLDYIVGTAILRVAGTVATLDQPAMTVLGTALRHGVGRAYVEAHEYGTAVRVSNGRTVIVEQRGKQPTYVRLTRRNAQRLAYILA